MRETWYVLEDGSSADPRQVAPDAKGVLRHKSGVAVAYGDHGNPRSRGVEVEDGRDVAAAKDADKKLSTKDRQMKSDKSGDPKYKTR